MKQARINDFFKKKTGELTTKKIITKTESTDSSIEKNQEKDGVILKSKKVIMSSDDEDMLDQIETQNLKEVVNSKKEDETPIKVEKLSPRKEKSSPKKASIKKPSKKSVTKAGGFFDKKEVEVKQESYLNQEIDLKQEINLKHESDLKQEDDLKHETEINEEIEEEKKLTEKMAKAEVNLFSLVLNEAKEKASGNGKFQLQLKYSELCNVFSEIESTTKRLEKLSSLTKFYVSILTQFSNDPEMANQMLITSTYLCINRLGPDYEGLELGIGESVLMRAVSEATGRTLVVIKQDTHKCGDLGKVAQQSRSNQKTLFQPEPLTLNSVFKTLKEIAMITGGSSMTKKVDKIKFLLVSCNNIEARFLIRSLEGKLRIGLAEKTVLVALAHASQIYKNGTKQVSKEKLESQLLKASEAIKTAYSELPNYEKIIPPLLKYDSIELKLHCSLTPGIPVKPMLAHPTKSLSEVLTRFEGIKFTCEYKYDGERAQIHKLEDGSVKIYSRNSEDMTQKYPDIMAQTDKFTKPNTTSYVLDCEAVAWDRSTKTILPFQVLSTRKRKDVQEKDITVQVVIFAFDLLYLNGQSLLRTSFSERKSLMAEHFNIIDGVFCFAKAMESDQVDDIQTFLDDSIADNCEGLMVKVYEGIESSYEPSKRSRNWLKVKKDYLSGIGDSLDLVVIGGYLGKGKRVGLYGGYLLACYDPESDTYQSICKIGTGFSDSDLDTQFKSLMSHVIDGPKGYYSYDRDSTKPDVWFEPNQVWEIKAADLSISPVYKAAIGKSDPIKGISLRFPRFIRIRDDKSPEQATTSGQVNDMYCQQAQVLQTNSSKEKGGYADDDFDY